MIHTIRRLMCDKFSVLCTLAELNEKQLRLETEGEENTMKLNVKIKRLNDEAVIPKYAREGDAGFDLVAVEDIIVEPGATVLVSTGLAFEIPPGYEMQIRPRSGVTVKTKLRVQLGTVDSGYRGEVKVIVDNTSRDNDIEEDFLLDITDNLVSALEYLGAWNNFESGSYIIRKGDRIAQAIIAPFETAHFVDAEKLEESVRGAGGFGHTGVDVQKSYDEIW
jgi:dUTP pyrophosphatase